MDYDYWAFILSIRFLLVLPIVISIIAWVYKHLKRKKDVGDNANVTVNNIEWEPNEKLKGIKNKLR